MSATPQFFYSIPFANFEDKNIERGLDIDALLATVPTGLETARTLRKWKRLTQSANQRLANARANYAANATAANATAANAEEFSRISIEVVSIPSSLDVCLRMAKARDETNKRRSEAKRVYRAARKYAHSTTLARYMALLEEYKQWQQDHYEEATKDWVVDPHAKAIQGAKEHLHKVLDDAKETYLRARVNAFVICDGPLD